VNSASPAVRRPTSRAKTPTRFSSGVDLPRHRLSRSKVSLLDRLVDVSINASQKQKSSQNPTQRSPARGSVITVCPHEFPQAPHERRKSTNTFAIEASCACFPVVSVRDSVESDTGKGVVRFFGSRDVSRGHQLSCKGAFTKESPPMQLCTLAHPHDKPEKTLLPTALVPTLSCEGLVTVRTTATALSLARDVLASVFLTVFAL